MYSLVFANKLAKLFSPKKKTIKTPRRTKCLFTLQWHLSEKCNLRCKHCYQEECSQEMLYNDYLESLNQFEDLINSLNDPDIKGLVTVTGGEPLLYPYFFDLCSKIKFKGFELAILTNGTLITDEIAKKIKEFNPFFVQVSIEGREKLHNEIRGKDSFKQATQGIKHLVNNGVYTSISFTSHKMNYKEFYNVAEIGAELGANMVWSDRLIPSGNGATMKEMMLSKDETKEFFEIMMKAKTDFKNKIYVKMQRALQFLVSDEAPYQCAAGKYLLTLMPNGDVYPCRRMAIKVGNVTEKTLSEIYYNNKVCKALRNPNAIAEDCKQCEHVHKCKGGLKCLNFALTQDPFTKDIGCWL